MILTAILLAGSALAADGPATAQMVSGHEHLRAVSLDLRGVVPEVDEYELLHGGELPPAVIDAWMEEDGFAERVAAQHRSLLWNRIGTVRLVPFQSRLSVRSGLYYRPGMAERLRRGRVWCEDRDAAFDSDGFPIAVERADGTLDEGAVWVEPYWASGYTVRVCAFDAMANLNAPDGTSCASIDGASDEQCGCGPELQWCATGDAEREILAALGADVDERVKQAALGGSYLDLLTGTTGYFSGPAVHFLRHMAARNNAFRFDPAPVDVARLPDLSFEQSEPVAVDLGQHHGGVFTSPAYLLRFQTQRSRANQYYNQFLCQPFIPPADGLPEGASGPITLDLTARDGCQNCHALLEPTAAYWGRWAQSGGAYLDAQEYPEYLEECGQCAVSGGCSDTCRSYYLVDRLSSEQDPYVGYLSAFEFLEERHADHVDEGPAMLVRRTIADGRVPACVVEKTAGWLLGRQMTSADRPWIDELAVDFVRSGYRYDALVREIVVSDNYRLLP